jgi:hypothetical protein
VHITRLQGAIKVAVNSELLFPSGDREMPPQAAKTIAERMAGIPRTTPESGCSGFGQLSSFDSTRPSVRHGSVAAEAVANIIVRLPHWLPESRQAASGQTCSFRFAPISVVQPERFISRKRP